MGKWEVGKLGSWEVGKLGSWEVGKLGMVEELKGSNFFRILDNCEKI